MIGLDLLRSHFPRLADALEARIVLLRKAISFGLIVVVNSLVDFAVFMVGVKVLGLPLTAANLLSWSVAVSGSYVLNSHITFAVESGRQLTWRGYGKFVASGVAGFLANTATVLFVTSLLTPLFAGDASGASAHPPGAAIAIAKLLAIGVSFACNFSISHFFVFRSRPQAAPVSERVRVD